MACKVILNPDNTILVILRLVRLSVDTTLDKIETIETPVTDAVASVTIKDLAGVDITGVSFPVSLPHDDNGFYVATIASTADLTEDTAVNVFITATSNSEDFNSQEKVFPVDNSLNKC